MSNFFENLYNFEKFQFRRLIINFDERKKFA